MKILFVTHYSQYYGANRSLVDMIQGFREIGYTIKVIVPSKGEFTEALEKIACAYEVIPFFPFVYRAMRLSFFLKKRRYKKNIAALAQLKIISQNFLPTFIYSNSSVFDIGFRLAKEEKIPHVWHIREMAELHYKYKFYPSKEYFISALKQTSLVISISQAIGQTILAPNGIKNYKVVYNAVFSKQKFINLPIKKESKNDTITFTVVGMLHPSKQQASVIKAFAQVNKKYKNTELWIAGSGQYLYTLYLKLLIRFYGLTNKVKLLGYLTDLNSIYAATDVVVTASLYEGLGRTTIEGMAYQKPIIGYNSGATPELIKNRGLLYSENDKNGLFLAMEKMINNPKERLKMGESGRAFVAENFMIDDYANTMNIILEDFWEKIKDKKSYKG